MEFTLPSLVPIDIGSSKYKDDLPPVLPRFFIPRLQEKPQDPIMDTLRIARESEPSRPVPLPQPLDVVDAKVQERSDASPEEGRALFWERAVKKEVRVQVSQVLDNVKSRCCSKHRGQSQIRSWDSLRPSFSRIVSPSPLLSEQSGSTFAAACY